jgi:hypothetical protein
MEGISEILGSAVKGYVFIGLVTTASVATNNSCTRLREGSVVINDSITMVVNEVDSKFFLDEKKNLYFSKYDSGYYNTYSLNYEKKKSNRLSRRGDFFSPLVINGYVGCLGDSAGNGQFRLYVNPIAGMQAEHVKMIGASVSGKYVLYQPEFNSAIFLWDSRARVARPVCQDVKDFHGYSFSSEDKSLIVSCNDDLWQIALDGYFSQTKIATDLRGAKLNPYLYNRTAYFVSDELTENYSIYSSELDNPSPCKLVRTGPNDLRLPKILGGRLSYLEISRSEYLLKVLDANGETKALTTSGVTYDYQQLNDSLIACTYSDLNTPRSMLLIHKATGMTTNLTGRSFDLGIRSTYINEPGRSAAYELRPPIGIPIRGLILFFHPGLTSDFSPRWDTILMALCMNGFIIVAPNYPMSYGYGKKFRSMNMGDAISDMTIWAREARRGHADIPMICLASSSGNLLMERVLDVVGNEVNCAISLFGLSANIPGKTSLPVMHVLGQNDPLIDCARRIADLKDSGFAPSDILVLGNEGHWIRKSKNFKTVLHGIINFIETND